MAMHVQDHLTQVHHCPSCVLRFVWRTELEHHLRDEHPEVHYEYVAAHEQLHALPVIPAQRR